MNVSLSVIRDKEELKLVIKNVGKNIRGRWEMRQVGRGCVELIATMKVMVRKCWEKKVKNKD